MRRFIPLVLLGISLSGIAARAQEVQSLTLQDCIDYALKNSMAARNARLDIELQKAVNAEVTGRTLPQINGEGTYTQFFDVQQAFLPSFFLSLPPGEWVPVGFSPKLNNVGQLNASQVLFNGSLFVALQARNALIQLARQKADMSLEDIRYNVQKAYAGLVIAHKQFDLMKSSLELLRRSTYDMQVTYDNGLVEKIELNRLQVQMSNLVADSMGLANMINVSETMLKYTIGMDLNIRIVLADQDVAENVEDASQLLLREADVENNITYQLAYTGLKLQEYDLKRYRFEGLPTLAAFGGAGYNRASDKFSDLVNKPYPGFSMVGLKLTIPVFDGLQRHNRVKQAKLKVLKAENDLENAKRGIDFQTSSAKVTLANALETVDSRKRTMDLAHSVLDLAQKKYKAGVGSNQDVILAQTDYLKSQNSYFEALQAVVNAKADLQKALGLLK